jgi:hypothetical protein
LAELIRDLFSVKCSEAEALSLLLNGAPNDSIPRKPDNGEGSLRKMLSRRFSAIWGAATEQIMHWKILIVRSKIALARKRATNSDAWPWIWLKRGS